jgi:hypothetical protein
LYSSPNVTGEDEMGGTYDTRERREMHTRILLGNLKETTAKTLERMGDKN